MNPKQAEAVAAALLEQPATKRPRAPFLVRFMALFVAGVAGAVAGAVLAWLLGGLVPVWSFAGFICSSLALFLFRVHVATQRPNSSFKPTSLRDAA